MHRLRARSAAVLSTPKQAQRGTCPCTDRMLDANLQRVHAPGIPTRSPRDPYARRPIFGTALHLHAQPAARDTTGIPMGSMRYASIPHLCLRLVAIYPASQIVALQLDAAVSLAARLTAMVPCRRRVSVRSHRIRPGLCAVTARTAKRQERNDRQESVVLFAHKRLALICHAAALP